MQKFRKISTEAKMSLTYLSGYPLERVIDQARIHMSDGWFLRQAHVGSVLEKYWFYNPATHRFRLILVDNRGVVEDNHDAREALEQQIAESKAKLESESNLSDEAKELIRRNLKILRDIEAPSSHQRAEMSDLLERGFFYDHEN